MPSSNRVARAFTKEVVLEQRLEVGDEDTQDEMFEAKRRASAKALMWKHALWIREMGESQCDQNGESERGEWR